MSPVDPIYHMYMEQMNINFFFLSLYGKQSHKKNRIGGKWKIHDNFIMKIIIGF